MGHGSFSKVDSFLDGSDHIGQTVSRGSIALKSDKSRFRSDSDICTW